MCKESESAHDGSILSVLHEQGRQSNASDTLPERARIAESAVRALDLPEQTRGVSRQGQHERSHRRMRAHQRPDVLPGRRGGDACGGGGTGCSRDAGRGGIGEGLVRTRVGIGDRLSVADGEGDAEGKWGEVWWRTTLQTLPQNGQSYSCLYSEYQGLISVFRRLSINLFCEEYIQILKRSKKCVGKGKD